VGYVLAVPRRTLRYGGSAGSQPAPSTYLQIIDATDGGGGADYHWRFADGSFPTASARSGGVTGTYTNTADLELGIDPIVANSASGKSVGFGGSTTAGNVQITIGGGGITLAAQRTENAQIQLDQHRSKHVLWTSGGGTVAGQFAREAISDGAGGLKPRFWTCNASGAPVIFVGVANGTIPHDGQSFNLSCIQQNGSPGTLRAFVNGQETALALESGSAAAPNTWAAVPAGTLYVGSWPDYADSCDGLMSELAFWNSILPATDLSSLATPASVVWLRSFDAGSVSTSQTVVLGLAAHAHPATGFTTTIVSQGTRGTASAAGEAVQYAAGTTTGTNDTFTFKITRNTVDSPTRTVTIDVVSSGQPQSYLPYEGTLYGSVWYSQTHGNDRMRERSVGDGAFFFAPHTGSVIGIKSHVRIGPNYSIDEGTDSTRDYAANPGDRGTYNVYIYNADPSTFLPINTSNPICMATGWIPIRTVPQGGYYPEIMFASPGQLSRGQPYFLAYKRTQAENLYFSQNHVWHNSFNATTSCVAPASGPGPANQAVASGGIEPDAVSSSSIARIKGWSPWKVDGKPRVPGGPIGRYTTQDGERDRRSGGCYEAQLIYADGVHAGWGGWGAASTLNSYKFALTSSNSTQVRHRFRVTRATLTVSGVFVLATAVAGTGGLRVILESGPTTETHFPSSVGTAMTTVDIDDSWFLPVPNTGFLKLDEPGTDAQSPIYSPHFVWAPFTSNQTLTLGNQYSIRLLGTGTAQMIMQGVVRADHVPHSPSGRTLSWAQWEAQREVSGEALDDCRDGAEFSTNAGQTWAATSGTIVYPIALKCV
jgi:hypothetical protein